MRDTKQPRSGYVYEPLPNDLRIHPDAMKEAGVETFEWKARVVMPHGATSPNNRRTRRADAAKARRRSAC